MAIRIKLDHLLLDRGITLTELADRVGITLANLSVLKTNKARAIRFSTLEALCRSWIASQASCWVDAAFNLDSWSSSRQGWSRPPTASSRSARGPGWFDRMRGRPTRARTPPGPLSTHVQAARQRINLILVTCEIQRSPTLPTLPTSPAFPPAATDAPVS